MIYAIKVSNSWREKVQQSEVSSDAEKNKEEPIQPSCEVRRILGF